MLLNPVFADKLKTVSTFLAVEYLSKKQTVIRIPFNPIFHNFIKYSYVELFIYIFKAELLVQVIPCFNHKLGLYFSNIWFNQLVVMLLIEIYVYQKFFTIAFGVFQKNRFYKFSIFLENFSNLTQDKVTFVLWGRSCVVCSFFKPETHGL